MRANLADITETYGESYQADSADPERSPAWDEIASSLVWAFPDAQTFLDVGAGAGPLPYALQKLGKEAWGIEGSVVATGLLPVPIIVWDLRVPLTVLRPFDVVTCFDVAEHVGNANAVVETCASAATEIVVFGAAPPGQDGHGHIDLREPAWWHGAFAERGYAVDRCRTNRLREHIKELPNTNKIWWVEKNLDVYRRAS